MEVGTTENSSAITNTITNTAITNTWEVGTTDAITNTRKHGGWNK